MSYKVDSIDIVFQQNFRLPIEHVDRLQAEIGDEHPESWLFDKPGNWQPAWEERDSYRYFNTLWWNGEGSGHTWETFVEKVLPCFKGHADIVVCWEGGDSYTGLRVRDGVVTKHKVVMSLGEECR